MSTLTAAAEHFGALLMNETFEKALSSPIHCPSLARE